MLRNFIFYSIVVRFIYTLAKYGRRFKCQVIGVPAEDGEGAFLEDTSVIIGMNRNLKAKIKPPYL